jgi:serine/threonine protein kinase
MHRDLKPENILLDSKGVPKICDFGLMKLENGLGEKGHSPGCGTFLYQSPEQRDGSNYDHKTDIYAVGIIGIELSLVRSTVMEIQKIIEQKTPLENKMPPLPALFLKMISKAPEERPESEEALLFMRRNLAKYFIKKARTFLL